MQLRLLCLPRYPPNDSPPSPSANLPSFPSAFASDFTLAALLPSLPMLPHPNPHPLPHAAPASLPALRSLSRRHFSPPLRSSTPILPLVSLMNGFTAGKVLIFIPLSDFCWLLLISNTQRKASESINKEMNTLHPATQPFSQLFTPDEGLRAGARSAFVPTEFSTPQELKHV